MKIEVKKHKEEKFEPFDIIIGIETIKEKSEINLVLNAALAGLQGKIFNADAFYTPFYEEVELVKELQDNIKLKT